LRRWKEREEEREGGKEEGREGGKEEGREVKLGFVTKRGLPRDAEL
jgi:hypothetical protein